MGCCVGCCDQTDMPLWDAVRGQTDMPLLNAVMGAVIRRICICGMP